MINPFRAKRRHTAPFQQSADLIKAYFLLKIFRIYHNCSSPCTQFHCIKYAKIRFFKHLLPTLSALLTEKRAMRRKKHQKLKKRDHYRFTLCCVLYTTSPPTYAKGSYDIYTILHITPTKATGQRKKSKSGATNVGNAARKV